MIAILNEIVRQWITPQVLLNIFFIWSDQVAIVEPTSFNCAIFSLDGVAVAMSLHLFEPANFIATVVKNRPCKSINVKFMRHEAFIDVAVRDASDEAVRFAILDLSREGAVFLVVFKPMVRKGKFMINTNLAFFQQPYNI